MQTTLPQSTLQSSDNYLTSRIFIGAGVIAGGMAIGGVLVEGGHYVGERDCQPRVELCAPTDKLWLPDGSEKDPSSPLGNLRAVTIATSTSAITPTNFVAPMIATK